MRPRPPTVGVLDEASEGDVVDLAAVRAARRSIARGRAPVTYPHVVETEVIELFPPALLQLHEDAARGRRDRAQRQAQARKATAAREERRGPWRRRAEQLDAALLDRDPDLAVKERAAVIAERLGLSPRTVRDHLYAHARVNVKGPRKL